MLGASLFFLAFIINEASHLQASEGKSAKQEQTKNSLKRNDAVQTSENKAAQQGQIKNRMNRSDAAQTSEDKADKEQTNGKLSRNDAVQNSENKAAQQGQIKNRMNRNDAIQIMLEHGFLPHLNLPYKKITEETLNVQTSKKICMKELIFSALTSR